MAFDNTNTCAVWKKKTKTGETYVYVAGTTESGESFKYNCFANTFKTEEKHPDFKSSKPKDDAPAAKKPVNSASVIDEDVPFN